MKTTELEQSGGVPSKVCKLCGKEFYKRSNYTQKTYPNSKYKGWEDVDVCGSCERKEK